MVLAVSPALPVIDFRRQSMVLQWNIPDGTWVACDVPPLLVHGVALIRAAQPNICLFGRDGGLHLQVAAETFSLTELEPRIQWSRDAASIGLRRRFTVESLDGVALLSHSYWTDQGDEFFSWAVARAADPEWRTVNGRLWSEGVQPAVVRSS